MSLTKPDPGNSHISQDELSYPCKLASPGESRRYPTLLGRLGPIIVDIVLAAPWPHIFFPVHGGERHGQV